MIPFQYDLAFDFIDGIARARQNNKWGFIDESGKALIAFQYDDAQDFHQGLAPVKQSGHYGFIDKSGKTKIDFQYEVANAFNGEAFVTKGGKSYYINRRGKFVRELEDPEAKEREFEKKTRKD